MLIFFAKTPLLFLKIEFNFIGGLFLILLNFLLRGLFFLFELFCFFSNCFEFWISLVLQNLNAFFIFLQGNEGFGNPVVGLYVFGVIVQTGFAILDNLSIIFVLQVYHGSVAMEFGQNTLIFWFQVNCLSILGVCFFQVVRTIGSLLETIVCLFLNLNEFTFKFSAIISGSSSYLKDCKAIRS